MSWSSAGGKVTGHELAVGLARRPPWQVAPVPWWNRRYQSKYLIDSLLLALADQGSSKSVLVDVDGVQTTLVNHRRGGYRYERWNDSAEANARGPEVELFDDSSGKVSSSAGAGARGSRAVR